MGAFAVQCGYGPDKVADAIARLRLHQQRTIRDVHVAEAKSSGIVLKKSDTRKLEKKCKRLVRCRGLVFTKLFRFLLKDWHIRRSSMDSIIITANNHITDLSVYGPIRTKVAARIPLFV